MAFCPHCGERASDSDTQCGKCGKSLTPAKKKARFAGTMMMDAGASAPGTAPAASAEPAQPKQLQETMVGGGATPAVASLRKPGAAAPRPSMDAALADTAPRPGGVPDASHRYLAGDPMAPEASGPRAPARRANVPNARSAPAPSKSSTLLIVLVLGLIAIGGMGYAAAFVLGLL